ncbi:MAG: Gfo/Idh/MocA family oxidoreductase [Sedimentisphaerales bacterium]|nr:Gfo/Idh/MocA family oxidoreductase [Sedimentisphaerales bacterium]
MSECREKTSRRRFLKNSAAAAAAVTLGLNPKGVPLTRAARGANERIRVGFIGVGNRGSQLLRGFLTQDDVEVAALCDVYEPYLMRDYSNVDKKLLDSLGATVPQMTEKLGANVARYKDFRRLLERRDIDAVVISTPDHWHAIQTIVACEAGKDVYVEKPLSVTIVEGRKMVEAAKRHNRVVQVGLHRRSSQAYQQLARDVQAGKIGKVTVARAYRISNMYPDGIGKYPDAAPPKGLDWDMWLGPRSERPYKDNIPLYKFRWWQSYSSQVANWGVHYCDAIRWVLAEEAPASISAHGGRFALDDDRTIPDTMEVIFELACGVLIVFGQYEASGGPVLVSGEIELRGTLGNIYAGAEGEGYTIVPSPPGQFQEAKPSIQPKKKEAPDRNKDLTVTHIRNFLDCIKTRAKTNCDIETGHRSTTFALLANIALATKSRIEWDPRNERITNNEKANELLHYEYRKPWKLT